jgi:tetratricopeptide (TPR) repeat protein
LNQTNSKSTANTDSKILDAQLSLRRQAKLLELEKKLISHPGDAQAHFSKGMLLEELGRFELALNGYAQAILLRPEIYEGHLYHGKLCFRLKKFHAALISFKNAAYLNPSQSDLFHNTALTLYNLNKIDEALEAYDKAIAINAKIAEYFYNRGGLLHLLKKNVEAIDSYSQAIKLDPENAEACWIKSNLQLLIGNFEEGWALHESRWKRKTYQIFNRHFSQPTWILGQSLVDKTLLIHCEAGMGDAIQFCRYIPLIDEPRSHIIFEVPKSLFVLMKSLSSHIVIIEKGSPLPHFDYHCPVMSLPLALKNKIKDIPKATPYLHSDANKEKIWNIRIGPKKNKRIGVAWSGLPGRSIDEHPSKNRSIPLEFLEPLQTLNAELFSLQKEIRPEDKKIFLNFKNIHDYSNELTNFSETAALIANLDLIISIDTSVAHLAGALNKELCILLPYSSDYRWGLDENKTIWYPKATLFRQDKSGEWANLIAPLMTYIKEWLNLK